MNESMHEPIQGPVQEPVDSPVHTPAGGQVDQPADATIGEPTVPMALAATPHAETELLRPLAIAWYGKLPWRGDFFGRGLPATWQRTWDEWLQRAIAEAGRRLGADDWRSAFAAMPPWHAVLLPERDGEPWRSAVVASSVDRVGRAFPIVVVETYDDSRLSGVALSALRGRGTALARWLADTPRSCASMKDFERAAAQWPADGWDGASDQLEDIGISVSALRELWPQARSFWWPAHVEAYAPPRAESWPPSEALLLEWIAVTDDRRGERRTAE